MRILYALALAVGLAAGNLGQTAMAGPASERLFATDVLDGIPEKGEIDYMHERVVLEAEGLRPVKDGRALVVLGVADGGTRATQVRMGSGDALRVVGTFPASSGNPLLPILLESSLRAMSTITGGSPFYIRNRIKEALGRADAISDLTVTVGGAEITATEIVIQPFLNDAKRDKMGGFAEMTLRFITAPEATGGFVLFSADTPPGPDGIVAYSERFQLNGTEIGG